MCHSKTALPSPPIRRGVRPTWQSLWVSPLLGRAPAKERNKELVIAGLFLFKIQTNETQSLSLDYHLTKGSKRPNEQHETPEKAIATNATPMFLAMP